MGRKETIQRIVSTVVLLLILAACGGREPGPPAILFLRQSPAGTMQLYRLSPGATAADQLTGVDNPAAPEVIDFAAAPDGERVVYSVSLSGGLASALRVVGANGRDDRPLLDCPAAECLGPVWSPDGARLIYERRPLDGGRLGSPRLQWLDPASGETLPLIEGDETPGYGARFSPDGEWISYVSLPDEGVVVYRLADGFQRLLPSRVGSPAAWSPDSTAVVYGDLVVVAHEMESEGVDLPPPFLESSYTFLYLTRVNEDGARQRLSPDAAVADGVPAWSPDGQWIAFGRSPANTGAARQLWLMRPDGGEARALTSDPAITYGPPNWSPDGRTLLYQRYETADLSAAMSIWQLDLATGEETMLIEGGYLPSWLPTG